MERERERERERGRERERVCVCQVQQEASIYNQAHTDTVTDLGQGGTKDSQISFDDEDGAKHQVYQVGEDHHVEHGFDNVLRLHRARQQPEACEFNSCIPPAHGHGEKHTTIHFSLPQPSPHHLIHTHTHTHT